MIDCKSFIHYSFMILNSFFMSSMWIERIYIPEDSEDKSNVYSLSDADLRIRTEPFIPIKVTVLGRLVLVPIIFICNCPLVGLGYTRISFSPINSFSKISSSCVSDKLRV